ncbi:MAG: hypothetical protein MEQ84_11490 [Mesorhizobium sp.]|nr:hypothetical protein [Mesorhizobium sp.]
MPTRAGARATPEGCGNKKGRPQAALLEKLCLSIYCFAAKIWRLSPPPISHATKMMQEKPNTALAVTPQQDF